MAQALAETVQLWHGGAWPPRSACVGTPPLELEGTVLRHYPLNIRKANEQQGYLKSTVSQDVNTKFRAVELQLTQLKSNGSIQPVDKLPELVRPFTQQVVGSSGASSPAALTNLFPRSGVAIVWCDAQLISILGAKEESSQSVELKGSTVRVTTDAATLLAKSVDILTHANQTKTKQSYEGHPNLMAAASAKYNPAVFSDQQQQQQASAQKKSNDDNDDDWDD